MRRILPPPLAKNKPFRAPRPVFARPSSSRLESRNRSRCQSFP